MKRFWKHAAVLEPDADGPTGAPDGAQGGWRIALDGRPVRTPDRRVLTLPVRRLADAIAAEWDGAGETVDVRAMPMTQLATTVIDRIAGGRGPLEAAVAAYGETDMLCYRATAPDLLVARQAKVWDPLLDWARERYRAELHPTAGIVAVPQPTDATDRLAAAVGALDDWRFGAVQVAVPLFGSLVLGLAFVERAVDADGAFDAAHLEELFQAEQWGADAEAVARRDALRGETRALARFLDLLDEEDR